jgi:hypothetical protein
MTSNILSPSKQCVRSATYCWSACPTPGRTGTLGEPVHSINLVENQVDNRSRLPDNGKIPTRAESFDEGGRGMPPAGREAVAKGSCARSLTVDSLPVVSPNRRLARPSGSGPHIRDRKRPAATRNANKVSRAEPSISYESTAVPVPGRRAPGRNPE